MSKQMRNVLRFGDPKASKRNTQTEVPSKVATLVQDMVTGRAPFQVAVYDALMEAHPALVSRTVTHGMSCSVGDALARVQAQMLARVLAAPKALSVLHFEHWDVEHDVFVRALSEVITNAVDTDNVELFKTLDRYVEGNLKLGVVDYFGQERFILTCIERHAHALLAHVFERNLVQVDDEKSRWFLDFGIESAIAYNNAHALCLLLESHSGALMPSSKLFMPAWSLLTRALLQGADPIRADFVLRRFAVVASKESLVHMREQAAAHKAIGSRLLYVKAVLAAEPLCVRDGHAHCLKMTTGHQLNDDGQIKLRWVNPFISAETYMTIKTHVDDQWKRGPLAALALSIDWNVLDEQVKAGVKFPRDMWETVFIRATYAGCITDLKSVQRNMLFMQGLDDDVLIHATAALVARRLRGDLHSTSIDMFQELLDMFCPKQQYVMRVAAVMTTAACGGDSHLLDTLISGGTWPEGQLNLVKQAAAAATTLWGQAGFTLPRRAAAEHLLAV